MSGSGENRTGKTNVRRYTCVEPSSSDDPLLTASLAYLHRILASQEGGLGGIHQSSIL